MEGRTVTLDLGIPVIADTDTTTHYTGIGDIIMHLTSPGGKQPDQFANGDQILIFPEPITDDLQLDISTDDNAGRMQTLLSSVQTPGDNSQPDCRVILNEAFLQANKNYLRILGSYYHYDNSEAGELVRGIRELSLSDIDRMILRKPSNTSAKKELWVYRK